MKLPYDKMIEICEGLDDKSLGQLIRTSKTAYNTCKSVLDERKERIEKVIKEIEDIITKREVTTFEKSIGKSKIEIKIINTTSFGNRSARRLSISQTIEPAEGSQNVPWILPNRVPVEDYITDPKIWRKSMRYREIVLDDEDSFNELARNLYYQKYLLSHH